MRVTGWKMTTFLYSWSKYFFVLSEGEFYCRISLLLDLHDTISVYVMNNYILKVS